MQVVAKLRGGYIKDSAGMSGRSSLLVLQNPFVQPFQMQMVITLVFKHLTRVIQKLICHGYRKLFNKTYNSCLVICVESRSVNC